MRQNILRFSAIFAVAVILLAPLLNTARAASSTDELVAQANATAEAGGQTAVSVFFGTFGTIMKYLLILGVLWFIYRMIKGHAH